jgi:hypothetical protein
LRLKSFQPGEEYVYLTYSLKNDKKEESRGTAGELQSPTAEGFRLVVGEVQGGEEGSEEG